MHGERKTITILWKIVVYDPIGMKKRISNKLCFSNKEGTNGIIGHTILLTLRYKEGNEIQEGG